MLVTRSARAVFRLANRTRAMRRSVRWLLTAVLIFGALGLRHLMFGGLLALPYLFFIPAILAASVFFGRSGGLFAIFLSVMMVIGEITPTNIPAGIAPSLNGLAVSIYAFICGLMWLVIQALQDAFLATDRALAEAEQARKTRDVMLVELGHRTKNDMARVMSMMTFQAAGAEPAVQEALRVASDRIATMARIHDRFRVADTNVVIDTRECLTGLIGDLRDSFDDGYKVSLSVDAESHILAANEGGALGLIANEIITNCLKHAFPVQHEGNIHVSFRRDGTDFVLRVRDDGAGMSATAQSRQGSGLGTKIIRALSKQLGGALTTAPADPGTETVLRFPAVRKDADLSTAEAKRPITISALPISMLG